MKLQELFEEERSVLSVCGRFPRVFTGIFVANNIELTSLKGSPEEIIGDFDCSANYLTSLEGAPSSIGGNFVCDYNAITSLHNIHKQIKYIGGYANFEYNPIKSHVLGLLLIKGLKYVYLTNGKVADIIDKHLSGDRDVFACQEELIEAGFEDYAQL
jgi:hypothetical protein